MTGTTEESVDAYVERLVEAAPDLSDEQRHTIAASLSGPR